MRKALIVCILLALAATAFAGNQAATSRVVVDRPSSNTDMLIGQLRTALVNIYGTQAFATNNYVGSEFCLSCHATLHPGSAEWLHTPHSFFIRQPMGMYSLQAGKGIMADYDKNGVDDFKQGLDFNTLTGTAVDDRKPNAPILSYDAATDRYFIQLGPGGLKLWVAATLAGQSATNGQRFICRFPVADTGSGWSSAVYFGPVAWNGTAFSSNAKDYYTGNVPKYAPGLTTAQLGNATTGLQGQNYLKNCSGCHITGIRNTYVSATGEFVVNPNPAILFADDNPNYPDLDGDGMADMVNIGCESCHGPGAQHILGRGDATKIVNPEDITNNKDRSVTCLQCHVQTGSAPTKLWGFTYDEVNHQGYKMQNPILPLANYQVSKGVKWPDGVNYSTARIDSYYSSDHYQGSHGIACNNCHDAHAETSNPAQVRDLMSSHGVTDIPASVENDSFCMSCHNAPYAFPTVTAAMVKDWDNNFPAIRAAIEEHTHHPYGADRIMGLSRCTTCHMAPGQSHSFMPARPEDTIAFQSVATSATVTGNVNSCSASCHRGLARVWLDVPINPTWDDKLYGTANEVMLANHLVEYFGPGGLWWNTTVVPAHGKVSQQPK